MARLMPAPLGTGEGGVKGTADEDPRHLALVVGRAMTVVDGVDGVRGGSRQLVDAVGEPRHRLLSGEALDCVETLRARADAADGQAQASCSWMRRRHQGGGHAEGRTLVDAELRVGGSRTRGPGSQADAREHLVVEPRGLVGVADELTDGKRPLPTPLPEAHLRVEEQKYGGQIAV